MLAITGHNLEIICQIVLWYETSLRIDCDYWAHGMGTYRLACASVAIYNSIYVCNISWCNIDGHYRSWIEYLTERYNVCTLDRSIQWDNTTNSDTKLHRNITLTRNTQQTKHLPVRTGTHKPIWMVKLTITTFFLYLQYNI